MGPDGPKTALGFYQFLEQAAKGCDALILCGDIFNAWIGDDQISKPSPWLAIALAELQKFSRQKNLYLMRGNRDFLMGEKLAHYVNATLLDDQVLISTELLTFVLSHGDELCTDDRSYQRFRNIVRKPLVQRAFYTLPLSWRKAIANYFRERSKAAGKHKSYTITDINNEACAQLLAKHKVAVLVHGHTHRPAIHTMSSNNNTHQIRIVLPDWELDDLFAQRSGWLSISSTQMVLHQLNQADRPCDIT